MYNILLDGIEANWEKFKAVHKGDFYGGSEVASIAGVGFESPLKVWLRKTGKIREVEETDQMWLGKRMEPVLIDLFAKKTAIIPEPVDQIWQHKDYSWWIASPDARIGDKDLVEFKLHKIYAEKYWGEHSASDSALCQLQWYLGCSGYEGGYCAALIGGDTEKFFTPYFKRDDDVISQLREQVEKFRDLVKQDIPPDAGPGDADLIHEHLIQEIEKTKEINLTDSHKDLMRRYRELLAQKEELAGTWSDIERGLKAIKNQIIKDSEGAGVIHIGKDVVKLHHISTPPRMTKGSDYIRATIKLGE